MPRPLLDDCRLHDRRHRTQPTQGCIACTDAVPEPWPFKLAAKADNIEAENPGGLAHFVSALAGNGRTWQGDQSPVGGSGRRHRRHAPVEPYRLPAEHASNLVMRRDDADRLVECL